MDISAWLQSLLELEELMSATPITVEIRKVLQVLLAQEGLKKMELERLLNT